jgi:hypothetical protein
LETLVVGEDIEKLNEDKTIRELKEEIKKEYYDFSNKEKEEPSFFSVY